MGLAFGLSAVGQTWQQEEEVVDVPQELLTLTGELEGGLVFEDAGGETQEAGQPVVLDRPVLLIQDLTAGGERNTEVMAGGCFTLNNKLTIQLKNKQLNPLLKIEKKLYSVYACLTS